jgi:hypothetical protein
MIRIHFKAEITTDGGRSKVQLQQIHAETQFSTQTKKQNKNAERKAKFNKTVTMCLSVFNTHLHSAKLLGK